MTTTLLLEGETEVKKPDESEIGVGVASCGVSVNVVWSEVDSKILSGDGHGCDCLEVSDL